MIPKNIKSKFYDGLDNSPVAVKKAGEYLKKVFQTDEKLEKFVSKNGYPVWNKSLIVPVQNLILSRNSSSGNSEEILIPLIESDTSFVKAALVCRIENDSIGVKLLDGEDIRNILNRAIHLFKRYLLS